MKRSETIHCDIAVIGGSFGGVAAALAAAAAGYRVVLSEATDWLGGQVTSQGVAPLDEHAHIETFGGTRTYTEFRNRIRRYYQERYGAPATMPDGAPLNPGNGWVSRLCFEPRVGLDVLEEMLRPHVRSGKVRVLLNHLPIAAEVQGGRVLNVKLEGQETVELSAPYFLDATDLGDLLPLTGTAYVTGAEARADTGEAQAKDVAAPEEVQSFTVCFAVEYRPGERHVIPKPEGYERFRDEQPYTLSFHKDTPREQNFKMFAYGERGEPPFWTYRRIFDAELLDDPAQPNDIALMNWAGNDYRFANLIGKPRSEQARILDEAKRLSLSFLYWLQTECPRDEGGTGYPELKLRPDVLGTNDGLAKAPYIRESRRIVALDRVSADDILETPDKGVRASFTPNSVGIGWYPLDLHPCVGSAETSAYDPTLPFQIPLGALVPKTTSNLLAACKNIGTTHLSNGAYRLQPVEWAVGEAAGTLATYCLQSARSPKEVWQSETLTAEVQSKLLARGVPLAWLIDRPPDHPQFAHAHKDLLRQAKTSEQAWIKSLTYEV